MKLISGVLSNNAAKVRIVLGEKNMSYETIEVPWTKEAAWEPKPTSLIEANPRAEVPVLIDEDLILWDSTVINEYLDDIQQEPAMIPRDAKFAALCRLWEDEGDHNQAHVGVLIRDVFLGEPGAPLTDDASAAMAGLMQFCQRVDEQLEGSDYLCGEYSVADVSVFMTIVFATTLGVELAGENLSAWFDRMMARPVIKREYEQIIAAVAAL